MTILYNIAFIIFALFYVPVFLFKKRKREGIGMRLGIYPAQLIDRLNQRPNIWVHAVSVGEVMAVSCLISGLRNRYPQARLVITTVTETGNAAAKKIADANDIVLFLPFDLSFVLNRVVSYIKPAILVIAETELWPNLISAVHKNNTPIILVNGRISDESYGSYRLIRLLLVHILKKITFFSMQTALDEKRIVSLGAEAEKVKVNGNMKFDNTSAEALSEQDYKTLRKNLGLDKGDKLLVAGSTHPGEEKILLSVFGRIKSSFSGLRLLIAPRHIERVPEIEVLVRKYGFEYLKISQLGTSSQYAVRDIQYAIYILDVMGRLRSYYNIADVVFVGGSLVKKGGQNMIEPAVYAKPVIFGPHTFNFRDIVAGFLKADAALLVNNAQSLEQAIAQLLQKTTTAEEIGKRAKRLVELNKGASAATLEAISGILKFDKKG